MRAADVGMLVLWLTFALFFGHVVDWDSWWGLEAVLFVLALILVDVAARNGKAVLWPIVATMLSGAVAVAGLVVHGLIWQAIVTALLTAVLVPANIRYRVAALAQEEDGDED